MIPKETVQQIKEASKIEDVIADFIDLKKSGSNLQGKCPSCDKDGKGKGLMVSPSKQIYKCFSCDFSGNASVKFLMEAQKKDYVGALEYLANKYKIPIIEEKRSRSPKKKTEARGKGKDTFCARQLLASGLNEKDVSLTIPIDEKTTEIKSSFRSGTKDEYGRIIGGDDMIIWYYDLEGKPVTYQKPKSSKFEQLYRIRWQIPEQHLDKRGNPMKYSSPFGSGSHIYIPEVTRKIYQAGRKIKTLYLQEGEKKAEKASKHGLVSVGVMGIHNVGSKGRLPHELLLIVTRCEVENVIFMLDSDWDHLSEKLHITKSVDQRPRTFFYAVKNFRAYFQTFVNMDIYLELYFAYIKENERNDKGIDDLLANTLEKKEDELKIDILKTLNEKDGEGTYVQINKITTLTDGKILEFWNLQGVEQFAEKYKESLKTMPEFKFSRHRWKFDENEEIVLAQPLNDNEQFWIVKETMDSRGDIKTSYYFDYENCYIFLRNRGYGRIMMLNKKYKWVKITGHVVETIQSWEIKDYVMEMAKEICPKEIRNMLYRGGKMYFGPDSLGNVDFVDPEFEIADKSFQLLFFQEKYWKISQDKIEEKPLTDLENYIWKEKVNDFDAKLCKEDIIEIVKIDEELTNKKGFERFKPHKGGFLVNATDQGLKCQFMDFLMNVSNFFWDKEEDLTWEEKVEINIHFVSKMSAIGYLLHQFFDPSNPKLVVGMDGKDSEVGSSNGGTGKSMFGDAIGQVIPQVVIPGKNKKIDEDIFIFEEVDETTSNVFIDDVRANFDIEFLYPNITGIFTVNKKGIGKYTIPKPLTPKIYIPTNHAITADDISARRRMFTIAFSDYYNETHQPIDDFGVRFFDEWDHEQKNLFYNFAAQCLKVYLKFGFVEPPMERLENRRLRQLMGEEFLTWADDYFCYDEVKEKFILFESKVNMRIARKEMFDHFIENNPKQTKYVTSNRFLKKIRAYCKYRSARFNPHKLNDLNQPGMADKSGGVEYFTIANDKFEAGESNKTE